MLRPLLNWTLVCKERCTLNEVERSMLVSAQTDRLVLRKTAPRTNNLKRANDLPRRIVTGIDLVRPRLKLNHRFGNCRLVLPHIFRVKVQ